MKLNEADRLPFLLKPVGKDYLWGGTKLRDLYSKDFMTDTVAESWECSTHPNGLSIVASGPFEGMSLSDVLLSHPEFLGSHPKCPPGRIPILVKLIDANSDLSIQVHPSDEYAFANENGQLGKTEMWYVIDAKPGASIVYGLKRKLEKNKVLRFATEGTIGKYLQRIPVHKNDVFIVEPGIVHAIGEGILIAEIQESSDLTYRLFDYNRVDKNGNRRELHIEKALSVMNFGSTPPPKQPLRVLKYTPGRATEALMRCKYFQVDRMLINTERVRDMADFRTGTSTFQILLCYEGCATITERSGWALNLFQGDSVFVPSESPALKIHGKASFLRIRC